MAFGVGRNIYVPVIVSSARAVGYAYSRGRNTFAHPSLWVTVGLDI